MTDPIFALIEQHRAAIQKFYAGQAAFDELERLYGPLDVGQVCEPACRAIRAVQCTLLSTTPTSMAGVVAVLRYVAVSNFDFEAPKEMGDTVLGDSLDHPDDDDLRAAGERFLPRLAEVVERLASHQEVLGDTL
jgi:hypothetical protein